MRSNFNFKNSGNDALANGSGGGGGRPPDNYSLTRQTSIYSLTFDELQSTVGGSGKDFGSMNMDELLKSIWNADENQNFGSIVASSGQEGSGRLQKQGSLTLHRTLSQRTVDEVWKNMSKEHGGGKDASGSTGGFGVPQRQQTLGEITIEEFLARAGVMREESQLPAKPNNLGYFGDLNNSSRPEFVYHQQANKDAGLMGDEVSGSSKNAIRSSDNFFANPVSSSAQKTENQQLKSQQLPQILPKPPDLAYRSPMGIQNSDQQNIPLGIARNSNPAMGNAFVQNAMQDGEIGMVGVGVNGVSVATASPALSTDGFTKSNGDTSSVPPVPFVFSNGLRGRRTAALDKVVERRQRRMIKNRESAARSRARKQAYTMELEEEVAKLKKEQEALLKKQEEMAKIQKNQVLEMMKQRNRSKRRCLGRRQTCRW